ncbi:MAG TPA: low molecular weight protein-tyrosine-phosphatase, partial [Burkholderiales bacterium]
MIRVLFVCLGNICRSPTAEAVFRHQVRAAGLEQRVLIDSAGTSDYHEGYAPDERARAAAGRRGYDMEGQQARQVTVRDFHDFQYLLAMDHANLADLKRLAPWEHAHKLRLFMDFSEAYRGHEVPDPYYGGAQGFERVLD